MSRNTNAVNSTACGNTGKVVVLIAIVALWAGILYAIARVYSETHPFSTCFEEPWWTKVNIVVVTLAMAMILHYVLHPRTLKSRFLHMLIGFLLMTLLFSQVEKPCSLEAPIDSVSRTGFALFETGNLVAERGEEACSASGLDILFKAGWTLVPLSLFLPFIWGTLSRGKKPRPATD